jgi:hypothetical protein
MKPRRHARLSLLLGVLGALGSRAARAADDPCEAVTVAADSDLNARFPDLLRQIQRAVATRSGIDTCARVELSLRNGAAVGVDVTLPDGRSASRTAAASEDVLPTLEALLLVPTRAANDAPDESAATPARLPARRARATPTPAARATRKQRAANASERDTLVGSRELAPRTLGVELSLISGARVGDGQTSFGLGALSFLEASGWLFGLEARADRYQSLTGDMQSTALELAFLLGRRSHFQNFALDLSAGPAIAESGIAGSDMEVVQAGTTPRPPEPPPQQSSGPVPRLLVGARLGFSPRSLFRTFVGIDGEVGPARAVENTDTRSPGFPNWTVGLAIGATLGTR